MSRELAGPAVASVAVVEVPAERGIVDVDDVLAEALQVAHEAASPNTRRAYATAYRQLHAFALRRGGGAPIARDDVDRDLVLAFRDELVADGLSVATVSARMSAIRRLADALDLDPRIARIRVTEPAGEQPVKALEADQVARLLAMPDRRTTIGRRDVAILRLLADQGLRREEIVRLGLLDDVVEARRHTDPRLRDAIAPGRGRQSALDVIVRDAKGGRSRQVPLAAATVADLRTWFAARPDVADVDALFVTLQPGRRSTAMSPQAIWELVRKHATAAGIPEDLCHPHALRHTFCTLLVERGAAIEVVRDLAGHADIRTTQRYVHVSDRRRRAAITETFDRGRSPLA